MSGQLGMETGTETPERVRVVGLDVKLALELLVDRLDNLTNLAQQPGSARRDLPLLILAGNRVEQDAALGLQLRRDRRADVCLVCDDLEVTVSLQQLDTNGEVALVGRRQLEVEDDATHRGEHMELVPEDRLLLGDDLAEAGSRGLPDGCGTRAWSQMELHNGNGQAVDHRLPIGGSVQLGQQRAAHQIEGLHQVASPPIEPRLRGQMGKERPILAPVAEQLGFHVPAATLADECHGQELAVAAQRLWSRPTEAGCDLLPDVVHHHVCPQAEVLEVVYHQWPPASLTRLLFPSHGTSELFSSTSSN